LKHSSRITILLFVCGTLLLTGCANGSQLIVNLGKNPTAVVPATPTVIINPSLWVDPLLPATVQEKIKSQSGFTLATRKDGVSLKLQLEPAAVSGENVIGQIQWVYALVAPFPTVTDSLTVQELKDLWTGNVAADAPANQLMVSRETHAIFNALWGASADATVTIVEEELLTKNDFKQPKVWAIVPFDQITPRWKVIKVDGLSPLDKPLDTNAYALKANFVLSSSTADAALQTIGKTILSAVPATDRDESKMTVVMMTGTTALTRAIAYKMEIKGLDYPIEKVKDWFKDADLIHVSNEVSFDPDCPYPDYQQRGLRFCSSPKYIQTLKDLGVNVVELTGNHENDYGSQYLDSSIDTYKQLGWYTFGGGKTPEEAQAPVKIEVNGNKIAFIGCNPNGPQSDWANEKQAGSAKCDMAYYDQQISDLKAQGYVVIATFQHEEVYTYLYGDFIANDFRNAAKAGADVVSGSQSHYGMGFQFVGNSLVHYGLGNFLFDMMTYEGVGDNIRREFFDKHIIYDGKYINTELYTAWLVDWSQPTPMDDKQRTSFLTDVFNASIWSEKP